MEGLGTGRCHADDPDPLAFQQATGGVQEARAVVNNETAQCHHTRIAPRLPGRLPASRKLGQRRSRYRLAKPRKQATACPPEGFPHSTNGGSPPCSLGGTRMALPVA